MTGLPIGFAVRLGAHVRVRDDGATLIGGAPLRVVHLNKVARGLLVHGRLTVADLTSSRLASQLLGAGLAEPDIERLDDIDPAQVTCLVPVRDRPAALSNLLAALGGAFDVIVVDDASRHPRPIADAAGAHGARLLTLTSNVGPAGARNAGLAAVTTPYVLMIDSDVTIDAGAVRRLGRHLRDPGLAMVAPRILGNETGSGPLASYEAARSSLDVGRIGGLVHPHSRIAWLPSACLLARTEAVRRGFDETMRVGEDVDLVWRLIDTGHRVRYEPDVVARHGHRTRMIPWLARKAFYGTSGAQLAERHGSKVAPAVMTPLGAGIGLAIIAQRSWSAPVGGLLAAVMAARLSRTLHRSRHPTRLAIELSGLGVGAVSGQVMGLLLRHWWPAAATAALFSRRARRGLLVAAALDTVIEYRRLTPDMDLLSFAIARRLDDLAYGTGLWAGAVRARSARCLLPRVSANAS